MDAAKLGRFIAETRKARGMTQAQLGARLYVTDKTVSKWERGAGFPDIRTLEPLAEALEVSLVDLMRGERTETESIPVETAEAMLTETLALTRERRPVEYLLGWSAVAAFGVAVLLLLLLLLTNGKIVAYSVTSLCLGLGAWLIPLLSLTWGRPRGPWAVLGSLSLAAAAVAAQFFQIRDHVRLGDWSSLEDTIDALAWVVLLFLAAAVLLNVLSVLLEHRARCTPRSLDRSRRCS